MALSKIAYAKNRLAELDKEKVAEVEESSLASENINLNGDDAENWVDFSKTKECSISQTQAVELSKIDAHLEVFCNETLAGHMSWRDDEYNKKKQRQQSVE